MSPGIQLKNRIVIKNGRTDHEQKNVKNTLTEQ